MDDSSIDAVARELTEGSAPANLRGRVLARIAEGNHGRRWPSAVQLAPAAVALAAAAALTMGLWPETPRQDEPAPSASAIAAPQTRGGPGALPGPRPSAAPTPPSRVASMDRAPFEDVPAAVASPALEPLALAAMSVDSLDPPDFPAPGPLEVTELYIGRLEIEPIGFPGDLQ